ncbi:MAG: hypothetical protein OWS74_09440, partial [Firmicutes bacterium]|nr:hypothetical protein [Bacillota bacterium]
MHKKKHTILPLISMTVLALFLSSAAGGTVKAATLPPTVLSAQPDSGHAEEIVVSGSNFEEASLTVTLNGAELPVQSVTPTQIIADLSPGQGSGNLVVTDAAGTSAGIFFSGSMQGYVTVNASGQVQSHGKVQSFGGLSSPPASSVVDVAANPTAPGYFVLEANGTIVSFGDAPTFPAAAVPSGQTAKKFVPLHNGNGGYVILSGGGIVPVGDAVTYGAVPEEFHVVDLTVIPQDTGYDLLSSSGAVLSMGAAPWVARGSLSTSTIPSVRLTPGSFVKLASNSSVFYV